MSKINFDVDIDFQDRDNALSLFPESIEASIIKEARRPHNTGVYFQSIPCTMDKKSTIDYKEAEELGYFKIDFINASVYEGVKSEDHLNELVNTEPFWDLLLEEDFVTNLFHIGSYPDLLKRYKPKTIDELAMILALIRPSKKHLQGNDWDTIKESIWQRPTDGSYHFKKSHAISYAMAIVVQMNLIVESAISSVG